MNPFQKQRRCLGFLLHLLVPHPIIEPYSWRPPSICEVSVQVAICNYSHSVQCLLTSLPNWCGSWEGR